MKPIALVLAILVLAPVAFAQQASGAQAAAAPAAKRPAVLVLPFRMLGPDQQYTWIGEAVSQNLLTELSRASTLHMLNLQQPAAGLEEKASLDLARASGATVLIVGSYQVADPEVRVTGKVLDVASGQIIGALKASGELRQILDVEDELAEQAKQLLGVAPPVALQPLDAAEPTTEVRGGNGPRLEPAETTPYREEVVTETRVEEPEWVSTYDDSYAYPYSPSYYRYDRYRPTYVYPYSYGYSYPYDPFYYRPYYYPYAYSHYYPYYYSSYYPFYFSYSYPSYFSFGFSYGQHYYPYYPYYPYKYYPYYPYRDRYHYYDRFGHAKKFDHGFDHRRDWDHRDAFRDRYERSAERAYDRGARYRESELDSRSSWLAERDSRDWLRSRDLRSDSVNLPERRAERDIRVSSPEVIRGGREDSAREASRSESAVRRPEADDRGARFRDDNAAVRRDSVSARDAVSQRDAVSSQRGERSDASVRAREPVVIRRGEPSPSADRTRSAEIRREPTREPAPAPRREAPAEVRRDSSSSRDRGSSVDRGSSEVRRAAPPPAASPSRGARFRGESSSSSPRSSISGDRAGRSSSVGRAPSMAPSRSGSIAPSRSGSIAPSRSGGSAPARSGGSAGRSGGSGGRSGGSAGRGGGGRGR